MRFLLYITTVFVIFGVTAGYGHAWHHHHGYVTYGTTAVPVMHTSAVMTTAVPVVHTNAVMTTALPVIPHVSVASIQPAGVTAASFGCSGGTAGATAASFGYSGGIPGTASTPAVASFPFGPLQQPLTGGQQPTGSFGSNLTLGAIREVLALIRDLRDFQNPPNPPQPPNPFSGNLDARLTKLESKVADIDQRLQAVEAKLASMKLPSPKQDGVDNRPKLP